MILIFLDDERNVEDVVWSPETQATAEKASKTIVVRNFNEFVKAINELKEQEEKLLFLLIMICVIFIRIHPIW